MTNSIAASPEPVDPTVPTPASSPTPATAKRGLPGIAIAGIAVGGVLVAGLLFGGGIAVGIALPIGGHSVETGQGGFPGGPQSGDQGTRPSRPGTDSNREMPTAPNSDDTETQDDSQQG